MRVEVGTIRWISRLGVISVWIVCGYEIIARSSGRASEGTPICFITHFCASYGLTLLSFAAFASTRRWDLMKIGILAAASAEAARMLTGAGFDVVNFMADLLGLLAVFVPSYLDGFRVLTRIDAHEPFSTVYSNRRRRSSDKHEA
jgi:hypothetical protein